MIDMWSGGAALMRSLAVVLTVTALAGSRGFGAEDQPQATPATWRVGVARRDITPKGPIWMAGYAMRNHPSEGAVHPLWAKALAVEDAEGQRAVIVTTDLIGLVREVSDPVCERVEQSLGLPRQRVLLNSSHTHCGPVIRKCAEVTYGLDAHQSEIIASYTQQLEDHLVAVIEEACGAMQPATLAYGEGEATFAINRRKPVDDGQGIGENPQRPVDHTVPVLAARAEDGRLLAVLFGYACHNTTTPIYQLNGDYAGFAQLALEEQHPGTTALFMIGCGADANPAPRGELALAQQHGQALGQSVDSVLAQPMQPVHSRLRTAFARVELPLVDPPSREAVLELATAENVYQQRLAKLLIQRYDADGALPDSYPFPVQVMRFGSEFSLIGLAGETLVDYAFRLRNELAGERLWVAGYCNEVFAYIPSERVLQEGGYEGGDAMVYYGFHGPFRPGLEDRIVGLVKQLMDQCAAGSP
ncbi:MAG: hypothetical protein GXY58_13340 [Planctomycetaceae bacterium]|nr:hypothetical protein [Planctomycetaceae bacterium]